MRSKIIPLFLFGILIYLLFWRFQVAHVRFFDADEFSYMHWAAQVARGERMYTDFFSYFTPGFMWAFAPIFWIAGRSAAVFTVGRTFSFAIFLGVLGALGLLWGLTRGWKWTLLPVVILAFLPMPYDKFLEIRPDNLATMLGVIGVIGEIRGLQTKKNMWWFLSGLFYSASLFVLAKTLPMAAVGAGIALLFSPKKFHYFLSGLAGPWIVFFGWHAAAGNGAAALYSLTKLPFEVYKSAATIAMEAHLFFYPNASFYGGTGHTITAGLLTNHALWILAICVGAYRLVVPKEHIRTELLVALTFFTLVYGYVKYFPAKHSQYLIPIAVFVAYYAADGLSLFFDWLARVGGYESLAIVLVGFSYLLGSVTGQVNAPKLLSTNAAQLTDLSRLTQTIPPASRVVDFEGRMVFWPEGYPVCCVSPDTTLAFVTRPPLPLAEYLKLHAADYIWDGDSGRLAELTPENLAYVHDHFTPVAGWGNRLWQRIR